MHASAAHQRHTHASTRARRYFYLDMYAELSNRRGGVRVWRARVACACGVRVFTARRHIFSRTHTRTHALYTAGVAMRVVYFLLLKSGARHLFRSYDLFVYYFDFPAPGPGPLLVPHIGTKHHLGKHGEVCYGSELCNGSVWY